MMILKRRGRLFFKSDLLNFSPKTDKISLPPLAGSYLSATLESSKKKKTTDELKLLPSAAVKSLSGVAFP